MGFQRNIFEQRAGGEVLIRSDQPFLIDEKGKTLGRELLRARPAEDRDEVVPTGIVGVDGTIRERVVNARR